MIESAFFSEKQDKEYPAAAGVPTIIWDVETNNNGVPITANVPPRFYVISRNEFLWHRGSE